MGRSHDLIVVFHFIDHKRGNVDSRAKIISNPGVRSNPESNPKSNPIRNGYILIISMIVHFIDHKRGDVDVKDLMEELHDITSSITNGDMSTLGFDGGIT